VTGAPGGDQGGAGLAGTRNGGRMGLAHSGRDPGRRRNRGGPGGRGLLSTGRLVWSDPSLRFSLGSP
jgi:hypothetical protein